jgi:6-phosphogluconolactonase (cycloisomerase 2 family)
MKSFNRALSLMAVAASLIGMAACGQNSNCSGISFGTNGGGGSGGSTNSSGSSCSSGGTGNNNALDYLYQTNGSLFEASYFNGTALQTLSGFSSPNLGSGAVSPMIIVQKKFMYQPWTPTGGTSELQGFTISSNGGLTAIAGSPFPTPSQSDPLVADPQGRFLYSAEGGSHTVTVFQINSTSGALTASPNSPFNMGDNITNVAVDASGKYLYASVGSHGTIVYGFSVNQTTGDLTALPTSPFFFDEAALIGHPKNSYLLGTAGGAVNTFAVDPNSGTLTLAATYAPPAEVGQLVIHPSGNYVYSFTVPPSTLQAFALDASGNLTPLTGSPYTALTPINDAQIDQNGTAIVGATANSQFYVVTIDANTGLPTGTAQSYGSSTPFYGFTSLP